MRYHMQRETSHHERDGLMTCLMAHPLAHGAAAPPADNETYFINDKNMVIRPADIDAYNQATGQTEGIFTWEEDQSATEATATDHKRPREEPNNSDDDDQARP